MRSPSTTTPPSLSRQRRTSGCGSSGSTSSCNSTRGQASPSPPGDPRRKFLQHLLPVDQTLHWANPSQECFFYNDDSGPGPPRRIYRTDCAGRDPEPYGGPVPIVTHVHGSHVDPESDGYPEAWWLPQYSNTQFNEIGSPFATKGKLFDDATGTNPGDLGYALFEYRNDQPATTLWFHDHSLGMTRLNVYAGPAAFWLIRGGPYGRVLDGAGPGGGQPKFAILPNPAPKRGQSAAEINLPGKARSRIREIPILIQDRTFLENGDLFYPGNRAFFETLNQPEQVDPQRQFDTQGIEALNEGCPAENPSCNITIPGDPNFEHTIGELKGDQEDGRFPTAPPEDPTPPDDPHDLSGGSMMPPIWNTEAFFNTIVVNGAVWPRLEVAPALYRFRFLNGSNARTLNMSLVVRPQEKSCEDVVAELGVAPISEERRELSFFQIGSDGGFLPQVVEIRTGTSTPLPGDGTRPRRQKSPYAIQGLLMAPAERADAIVDFRDLDDGTEICLVNTAPDSPFGGFGRGDPPADPKLTGQVMKFVVDSSLSVPQDRKATSPYLLQPITRPKLEPGSDPVVRISLNEQDTDFPIAQDASGEPVSLLMVKSQPPGQPTTGEFAVCARVQCTYEGEGPDGELPDPRVFSLPPSGFEDESPCPGDPDPVATIDIVGLSIEPVPLGGAACTRFNMCSQGLRQGELCADDDECNLPCSESDDCTCTDDGNACTSDDQCDDGSCEGPNRCIFAAPYGPMVDLLGTVQDSDGLPVGIPLRWTDDSGVSTQVPIVLQNGRVEQVGVSEYPDFGATQDWAIHNYTPDAHPIHIHLVQFNVLDRQPIPGFPPCGPDAPPDACFDPALTGEVFPQEEGWKDTVISHPGQITTVRAKFDIAGLYVWHCHILEHEDNEMMRPFAVAPPEAEDSPAPGGVPASPPGPKKGKGSEKKPQKGRGGR